MFYKMYICVYLAIYIMWPLFLNDSQTPNIIYFLTQRVYKGAYFYNVAFFFTEYFDCIVSFKINYL